jgi:putative flippase GtrA
LPIYVASADVVQRRVLGFALVGAIGFLIDAGLLAAQVYLFGVGAYTARLWSFAAAVTTTWWLNRGHTFRGLGRYSAGTEYRRYLGVQICGALANLGTYAGILFLIPSFAGYPVLALAIGAVPGLAVNYILSRRFVFPGGRR